MGNTQSNSNMGGLIYKITSKFSFSDLTCKQILEQREKMREYWKNQGDNDVDSEVSQLKLEEVAKKQIDFMLDNGQIRKHVSCPNCHPFTNYQIGDYVIIGLSLRSEDDESSLYIKDSNDMKIVGRPDSEGNIRDSNGTLLKFVMDTNKYLGWQAKEREKLLAAREYGQWACQTQAWTSHNLPPK